MGLTGKQKKYLKKNIKNRSVEAVSKDLNISKNEIENYLTKIWGKEKVEKILFKTGAPENERVFEIPPSLKSWVSNNKGALILLLMLVIVSYANSLRNGFVADDIRAIQESKRIGSVNYFWHAPFLNPRYLLIFLTHKLAGANPMFYRIPNILLHLGSSLVLYFIASLTFKRNVAFLASAIFAVHPLQTEAVTWISGGAYSFGTFFSLSSIALYIISQKRRVFYYPALLSATIGILSSTQSIVLIPLIVLVEWLSAGSVKNWRRLLPFLMLLAVLVFPYFGEVGKRAETLKTSYYQEGAGQNPIIQIPIAVTSYMQLMVWPKSLTLYHSEMRFSAVNYSLRLGVFILFCAFAVYTFIKRRKLSFWIALFFIALSPTLLPYGISWIVAERYVYFGAIGIYVLFAYFTKKAVKDEFLYYMVTALIIIPLSVRTVIRNADWKNQDTLWIATAKASPSSPQNHNNLGDLYGRRGDYKRAIEEFNKAIDLKPGYADAYHNLANTYRETGQLQKAIENYKKAIEIKPTLWQSYQNIAAIYFDKENYDLAIEYMKNALEINPNNANLHLSMSVIYLKSGNNELARKEALKALELDPSSEGANFILRKAENN